VTLSERHTPLPGPLHQSYFYGKCTVDGALNGRRRYPRARIAFAYAQFNALCLFRPLKQLRGKSVPVFAGRPTSAAAWRAALKRTIRQRLPSVRATPDQVTVVVT
jgi:hypothetical protein